MVYFLGLQRQRFSRFRFATLQILYERQLSVLINLFIDVLSSPETEFSVEKIV
jgi:hypothetical protein